MQLLLLLVMLGFCGLLHNNAEAAESQWSLLRQSDYDLKIEIAKLDYFNTSIFKYVKFDAVPFNRTIRALNASLEVLYNLSKNIMVVVKTYQFLSNEYRYFPLTFGFDACVEYTHDSFGIKEMFDKTSNIQPCALTKGYHYLINALPDFSKWPPHIPYGRYSLHLDISDKPNKMLMLVFYLEIKEKQKHWK